MANSAPGAWFRLQNAFFLDPKVVRAGPMGALVFLATITKAKLAGYRNGRVPREDLAPEIMERYLGLPSDVTVTALARCIEVGLLVEDPSEPSYLFIPAWSRYQRDPKVNERVAKHRQGKAGVVTDDSGCNGCNDDVDVDSTRLDATEDPPLTPPPPRARKDAEDGAPGDEARIPHRGALDVERGPQAAPQAGSRPDPEDGQAPPNRGYLGGGLAQMLNMAGVGSSHLRTRPGKWWEWEKAVLAVHQGGAPGEKIVAVLKSRDHAMLMPHQFLEVFQPRDPRGRPMVPQPPRARDRGGRADDAKRERVAALARLPDDQRAAELTRLRTVYGDTVATDLEAAVQEVIAGGGS